MDYEDPSSHVSNVPLELAHNIQNPYYGIDEPIESFRANTAVIENTTKVENQ